MARQHHAILFAVILLSIQSSVTGFMVPAFYSSALSGSSWRLRSSSTSFSKVCMISSGLGDDSHRSSIQLDTNMGRRALLQVAASIAVVNVCGERVSAAESPPAAGKTAEKEAEFPTISLKDFYKALYDQQVESVEFDGAMYERAYVTMGGKVYLIGEGYPKESSVNSSGPQQVLAKIKNEIKAGNPVTWSWRFATNFVAAKKEKSAKDDKAKEEKAKEEKGKAATDTATAADANEGAKSEDKQGGGFSFPFSLPAPPKAL